MTVSRFPWRVGRKVGRTIYRQTGPDPSDADELIGVMDTPALAYEVVRTRNAFWPMPRQGPIEIPTVEVVEAPPDVDHCAEQGRDA